jgi:hypothetical protein
MRSLVSVGGPTMTMPTTQERRDAVEEYFTDGLEGMSNGAHWREATLFEVTTNGI